jgi:hypothetical protein
LKFTTQQLLNHPKFAQLTGTAAKAFKPQTANAAPGVRIRQDSKPLMNKLEMEWFNRLGGMASTRNLRAQAIRVKLANGLWFKVDITCIIDGKMTCFEVKGSFAFRGGFENLKSAASLFPEWDWFLVWKDDGQWKSQKVLP